MGKAYKKIWLILGGGYISGYNYALRIKKL